MPFFAFTQEAVSNANITMLDEIVVVKAGANVFQQVDKN